MNTVTTLAELLAIREMRLEKAQKLVTQAQATKVQAEREEALARSEQVDLSNKLPGLVDGIYANCIGREVGKDTVEEARAKEMKLRDQERQAVARVQECMQAVSKAMTALQEAVDELARQHHKRDALAELHDDERAKAKKLKEKAEEKKLQEHFTLKD